MKKVGIWIRVSTLDQKRGDSPEIHEKRARMHAKLKDWEVVTIYHLEGISGKTVIAQEETERMLSDIRNKRIEGLIFSKLARLARNTRELLSFADIFKENDAHLISLQESIDTSTPAGRFFYTMISAMAQWEIEETSERIHASIITRRALGKMTGGMASFGYKIEDAQLVVNENEAPIRKLMYELFLEHKRRSTVARLLNEKGYRTRKGKKFSDVTVTRLLKNSDAKGVRKSNYRGVKTKSNPTGEKPKDEWIFSPCPPIVSSKLWDAVNAIIQEQESKSAHAKPLNQRVHLFTSYLYCHNGHKMSIQSKTNKYSCVQCKVRIDKDDLEDVFLTRLNQFFASNNEIETYIKSSDKVLQNQKGQVEFTRKKVADIEKKMDRLIELNIKGEIPTKGFEKHYNPLHEQSEELNKTLAKLEKEFSDMNNISNSVETLIKKSKDFYKNWSTLERPDKRSIVEAVVNNIEFDGREIIFRLKQIAPLSSLELDTNGLQHDTMSLHGGKLLVSSKNT